MAEAGHDLSRFMATYFEECAELIAAAEEAISRLKAGAGGIEDLHSVFRSVHSIKGGGGAFGFTALVKYAHVLETALDALRSGKIELTLNGAELLLKANDVLADFVRAAQEKSPLPEGHGGHILAELALMLKGEMPKDSVASAQVKKADSQGKAEYLVHFRPLSGMLRTGNEPLLMIREMLNLGEVTVMADVSRIPALIEIDEGDCLISWTFKVITDKGVDAINEVFEFVAGDCAEIRIEKPEKKEEHEASLLHPDHHPDEVAANTSAGVHTSTIRVDLDKIDRLVNMVGELVITQAMLSQQAGHISVESHPELVQGLQELSHHTRDLQESVMAIRAQPVKALFSKAPRLVRDLSAKLNKEIRLITSGENTEVDKTVIEQLSDPMVHLIRNALDHGIETPEERIKAGKPPEGTIHLAAEHRSGRIVIEISDDGRGINRKKVMEKALAKGLVQPGDILSDEQIDHLIFAPGFSTVDNVSDVSGRGVGMDVVRKNIQDCGGRVIVQSTPGVGSKFILSLPLTLAVMDGMIIAVGAERYVLPLTNIIESLRPTSQQARDLVEVGNVLLLRGAYIRLIPLHTSFGVKNAITDITKGLVVVVETEGGDRVGLLVDELLGQQQVVIKSLESNFIPVRGISAATILGDGKVALILDVAALRIMGDELSRASNKEMHKEWSQGTGSENTSRIAAE